MNKQLDEEVNPEPMNYYDRLDELFAQAHLPSDFKGNVFSASS